MVSSMFLQVRLSVVFCWLISIDGFTCPQPQISLSSFTPRLSRNENAFSLNSKVFNEDVNTLTPVDEEVFKDNASQYPYTDDDVKNAANGIIGLSFFFLSTLYFLISHDTAPVSANDLNPIGFFAVMGAIVTFGSSGIVFKMPSLQTEDVDPLVFQLYSTIGIAAMSLPLLGFLILTDNFNFEPWGLLGAADTILTSAFSFLAVRQIGYTVAPAIWAGIGMISAFAWGTVGFQESVNNFIGAISALLLLSFGVFGIATSKDAIVENSDSTSQTSEIHPSQQQQKVVDSDNIPNALVSQTIIGSGFFFCLLTGIFDGTLMVPFKMHSIGGDDGLMSTLNYLCSLGLGSLVTTPLLFLAYCIFLKKEIPELKYKIAAYPGIMSGILWGPGQLLSVHATQYFGMSVGFPLTQTCILVNALWGILFFKEVDPRNVGFLQQFGLSVFFVLVGASMLSAYG